MIQPVRKSRAVANGIDTTKYFYTVLFDMNNIMKIASVDHKMNSDGNEYGIILTSLRIMGRVLRMKDFDYCVAAYDGEGSGVLRWQHYKDYKANRNKRYFGCAPDASKYDKYVHDYVKMVILNSRKRRGGEKETEEESFSRQKSVLQNILDELCVRQYEFENVEGDDIISYYVKCKEPNEKVVIVSSDEDLTQLISDTVIIYNPRKRDFVTRQNAVESIGIPPENVVLKKILCGDASDNIKGVKGMGEGTLYKLFPFIRTEKADLEAVIGESRRLLEERRRQKKKPLRVLENVVGGVTDGCQGDRLYEVNRKIIDLSEPLLTDEARTNMDEEFHAPMDVTSRDIRNVYAIAEANKVNDILDEDRFGDVIGPFGRVVMMERRRYDEYVSGKKS